jgi:uncharacterized protein YcbK (DUF882 family)
MAIYTKNSIVKLSKNFKSTEFDCKGKGCCKATKIDRKLVICLQQIRNHFGKAVIINSGYRCKAHNKAAGGVSSSQHLLGKADDIVVRGVDPREVAKFAESIGVNGVGRYKTFTHVDVRDGKARWKG